MSSILTRVALVFLVACGPHSATKPTDAKQTIPVKTSPTKVAAPPVTGPQGQPVVLGWYCPTLASGRPAVRPLFSSPKGWESAQLGRAIQSRQARTFSVWSFDGRRAGSLAVLGASQQAEQTIAIGSYVGASPCDEARVLGQQSSENSICMLDQKGCGLATALLEKSSGLHSRPYDEEPNPSGMPVGKACVAEDILVIDVDGDGQVERFDLSALRDGLVPPGELELRPDSMAQCDGTFSTRLSEQGRSIIAVADVDFDGRQEVIVHDPELGFWLFAAPNSAGRLELVGRTQ